MRTLTPSFLWMKLASTWPKEDGVAGMSSATVDVPGQRRGNITICAGISENGVVTHISSLGPYYTQKLLVFLDRLHSDLIPLHERGLVGPHLPTFVIVWDNVSFHRGLLIRAWFFAHPRMLMVLSSPYSPFLNPIEEFFSAWRWRVYEHRAQNQRSLGDEPQQSRRNFSFWGH